VAPLQAERCTERPRHHSRSQWAVIDTTGLPFKCRRKGILCFSLVFSRSFCDITFIPRFLNSHFISIFPSGTNLNASRICIQKQFRHTHNDKEHLALFILHNPLSVLTKHIVHILFIVKFFYNRSIRESRLETDGQLW
jgi:hypothetical protein